MKRLVISFNILIIIILIAYMLWANSIFPTNDMNSYTEDMDTMSRSSSYSYWALPMDSSVLDSIKYRRQIDTTDYGLPLPIDEYRMCVKRYGEPQSSITLDMFLGKWYGYGHLYEPIHVLTFYENGSYTSSSIPVIELNDNNLPIYGTETDEYLGKYKYEPTKNQITLIDAVQEKDLTRADYLKYEKPRNTNLIVFSLEKDTMFIYGYTGDCWPYYRRMF